MMLIKQYIIQERNLENEIIMSIFVYQVSDKRFH